MNYCSYCASFFKNNFSNELACIPQFSTVPSPSPRLAVVFTRFRVDQKAIAGAVSATATDNHSQQIIHSSYVPITMRHKADRRNIGRGGMGNETGSVSRNGLGERGAGGARRRHHTRSHKLKILAQADRCTRRGELVSLARREGPLSGALGAFPVLSRSVRIINRVRLSYELHLAPGAVCRETGMFHLRRGMPPLDMAGRSRVSILGSGGGVFGLEMAQKPVFRPFFMVFGLFWAIFCLKTAFPVPPRLWRIGTAPGSSPRATIGRTARRVGPTRPTFPNLGGLRVLGERRI